MLEAFRRRGTVALPGPYARWSVSSVPQPVRFDRGALLNPPWDASGAVGTRSNHARSALALGVPAVNASDAWLENLRGVGQVDVLYLEGSKRSTLI